MIMECEIYSSSESGAICVSFNQYINGFLRIGYRGLRVHAICVENSEIVEIIGVDNYDN